MKTTIRSLCLFSVLCIITGCVERDEKIHIHDDGSIALQVQFKADEQTELYPGRTPTESDGWTIQEKSETNLKGETKHYLTALKEFPSIEAMPFNYAGQNAGELEAALYLQFPTGLSIEYRDDGTYYHFRRVYQNRPWADINWIRDQVVKLQSFDETLLLRNPNDLTDDERVKLIRLMAEVEIRKKLKFARWSYLDITPEAPQDGWLRVRQESLDLLSELNYEHVIGLMKDNETEAGQSALNAAVEAFDNAIDERIASALSNLDEYSDTRLRLFDERYRWHQRYHIITEDLGAEALSITVQMPGTIVGSNATTATQREATWQFSGQWLRDSNYELIVTSRIPTQKDNH